MKDRHERHPALIRRSARVVVAVAALALLGCASQPPSAAAPATVAAPETPDSGTKTPESSPEPATPEISVEAENLARETCANTSYANCYNALVTWMASSPGKLVAICELTPPGGGITEIPSEEEAAEFCSGGGTIARSEVLTTLRLPE
jgi:hypothetical protein